MTEDKIKYILSLFQGELDKYSNDDEYLNLLFSYIISLKEENAKLIEKINEQQ